MSARKNRFSTLAKCRLLGCVWSLAACSPTLDWRDNVAVGTDLVASFPCHPDRQARTVEVLGRKVQIDMLVCAAGDVTYAVSFFDVSEPAMIGPFLAGLHKALIDNLQAAAPAGGPVRPGWQALALQLKGLTPNAQSGRWRLEGRRPDGSTFSTQAALFTKGVRVYQAAVVGSVLTVDAVEPFFAGLKFPD